MSTKHLPKTVIHRMADKLHEKTNIALIDCFAVLKEAEYDMERAIKIAQNWHKTRLL